MIDLNSKSIKNLFFLLIFFVLSLLQMHKTLFGQEMPMIHNFSMNQIDARYIWLPILFENGIPVLKWHDKWNIERAKYSRVLYINIIKYIK